MGRCTKVETEQRLLMIQAWIVEGVHPSEIVRQITKREWCGRRQAERMLSEARERWVRHEEQDITRKRLLKIQELRQQIRNMKDVHKGTPAGIRAIVAVQKEIIKLEGIAMPIKIETTGKDGGPIQHEHKDEIDYTLLSDEVLLALYNAKKKAA